MTVKRERQATVKQAKVSIANNLWWVQSKLGRADCEVKRELIAAYCRSLIKYLITPLLAAGYLKLTDVSSLENETIMRVFRQPRVLPRTTVINTVCYQQPIEEVVSRLARRVNATINASQKKIDESDGTKDRTTNRRKTLRYLPANISPRAHKRQGHALLVEHDLLRHVNVTPPLKIWGTTNCSLGRRKHARSLTDSVRRTWTNGLTRITRRPLLTSRSLPPIFKFCWPKARSNIQQGRSARMPYDTTNKEEGKTQERVKRGYG